MRIKFRLLSRVVLVVCGIYCFRIYLQWSDRPVLGVEITPTTPQFKTDGRKDVDVAKITVPVVDRVLTIKPRSVETKLPPWVSTGFLQDGLWRFREQIDEWKEDVPQTVNRTRYLVFYCDHLCGGWADRQEGIVAVYLLAAMTGRRFYIQHDNPCPLTDFYAPNRLDWRLTGDVKQKLKNLSSLKMARYNAAAFRLGEAMVTMDLDTILNTDVVYLATNQDFYKYLKYNPRWKHLRWAESMTRMGVYTAVWEYLFKLIPAMESSLISFTEQLHNPDGLNGERYKLVCGQFRLKKNPTMPNDSPSYYALDPTPVWEFLQPYNLSDEYRIFVSSDAEEMRRLARAKFPETHIDVPGSIIHIDKVSNDRYMCENGFKKVLLDQLALASCDILLRGHDTHLGAVAAYWRGSNENLSCYNGTHVYQCSTVDDDFHFGPVYKLGVTKHWEKFVQERGDRARKIAQAEAADTRRREEDAKSG